MKTLANLFFLLILISQTGCIRKDKSDRETILMDSNWQFINEDIKRAEKPSTKTTDWETVTVPHDWAISGEFDENNDSLTVLVWEDNERVPSLRTGRTGGLPHVGVGWYRKNLDIPSAWKDKKVSIEFDGVMSNAKVYLNGNFVGEWPYGYASFGFDLTEYVNFGGENILAVRAENKHRSARWYPGAGIYRNVRMIVTNPTHVKQWGTYITTPNLAAGKGDVNIATTILNQGKEKITLVTEIVDDSGNVIVSDSEETEIDTEGTVKQILTVSSYKLWSVEKPVLYKAISKIMKDGQLVDTYETTFGFRFIEFTNNNGFFLNGERVQLNGVCLHHDLGPLGAAVNYSALEYRMKMLQEMGCNSIRTSHNPPTPEMLQLADEMGFLIIDEAFDEWKFAKCKNGYHVLWDEWAEKDMTAFIQRDRNHPSVIMWSIGNEVREQSSKEGAGYCQFLVDICKKEDPTRPTTAGFNRWSEAIEYGLAEIVDVPGWNYKPHKYAEIHERFPEWKMYGSETASTVSSRGEYFLPAKVRKHHQREDRFHCSAFDMEYPNWATSPDTEFAAQDKYKFMAGEYVWTGFDYLGEPTPYNKEWPSRSSYFGIIDLSNIPKDRYYLYQSKWTDKEVLHLLPHWNWEGNEGEDISVHCYTNFDKAELFLNGKSQGVQQKDPSQLYRKYRLIWDVPYEAGELKVVALDKDNNPVKETVVNTAGQPAAIKLETELTTIAANGKEIAFVTVSVVDKNGVVCPLAANQINFTVEGEGRLKAVGNGDQTSLESFVKPTRKTFNGKCMVFIQSTEKTGKIKLIAQSDGLKDAEINIETI